MAFCINCGKQLPEGAKFCDGCGTALGQVSNQIGRQKGPAALKNLTLWRKTSTIVIVILSIMTLVAFLAGKTFSAIIALVAVALAVISILMRKQIIKTSKSWLHIIALALAIIIAIPYIGFFRTDYGNAESFKWTDLKLSQMLPKPHICFGEVYSNYDDYLSLIIYKTNKEQYKDYINKCKEIGFTVETDDNDCTFDAFDKKGYKLSLYHYESNMSITLDAPEKFDTFEWPNNNLGKLLPAPKSNIGKINKNEATEFKAFVSNTPLEEFKVYYKLCADKGFNIEKNESEKQYSAKNIDGYKLSVDYIGNSVIEITITEPKYVVNFDVQCVENLIFSKYDVDIYFDGDLKGTVEHGATEEFSVTVKKGKYNIKFASKENDELKGIVTINIVQNEDLKFKISCSSVGINVTTVEGPKGKPTTEKVDYVDAESFEKALNNGVKVKEKTVQFNVKEYKPDSAIGINCWSGEHLNFISGKELDVQIGSIIVGKITKEPTNTLGSWIINYQALSIDGKIIKNPTTEEPKTEKTIKPEETTSKPESKPTETKKPNTSQIVLPKSGSKLDKDFDSKSEKTAYYINVDGVSNKPSIKKWNSATVTDGVAEYLDYLKSLGFTVSITDSSAKEPSSGFHLYETNFKVSNANISWTMYLCIQDEAYVEYELDIDL